MDTDPILQTSDAGEEGQSFSNGGNWQRYIISRDPLFDEAGSDVYLAEDPVLKRSVAIKRISKKLKSAQGEAILMANYGMSPFLPQIFDYFTFGHDAFIVMEHVPGNRLSNDSLKTKKMEIGKAVRISMNILRGLRNLHTQNYLHCNIQPRNILIDEGRSNSVKIVNFSHAVRKRLDGFWKGPFPGGSWEFMPPEQFVEPANFEAPNQLNGEVTLNETADLYSVGAVCLFLITGKATFAPSFDISTDPVRYYQACFELHKAGILSDFEGVPPDLMNVLRKALDPDQERRFLTSHYFLNALRPFEQLSPEGVDPRKTI